MEPRSVDYPDYVKVYQGKCQELFQQLVSVEAKLLVATEYAGELIQVVEQLQAENKSLQSKLNKKAPARKAASNYQEASVD